MATSPRTKGSGIRHGELPRDHLDFLAIPKDDPELALVFADLNTWAEAHPCECEALCICDNEGGV